MSKSETTGKILIIAGTVLILSALLLFMGNFNESREAGRNSDEILSGLEAVMEDITQKEEVSSVNMPEVIIDGREYIGYISVPVLDISLPVQSSWDMEKLKISPCRHQGSITENNLVIAAHNYRSHFAGLKKLRPGDIVEFTDMNGIKYLYEAAKTEVISPFAVDYVLNSSYPLVLYTCTPGGKTRVAVFCLQK